MAFGRGKVSTEAEPIKRYFGIAPVFILGVNPKTKEELSKILGREVDTVPEYIVKNDSGISVRLDFYYRTDEKTCGVNMTNKVSFFITKPNESWEDGKKKQVIDEFGRTAWVTQSEFNAKSTTLQKNDGGTYNAKITSNYRLAYKNEEYVSELIREYLGLEKADIWDNNSGTFMFNPKADECRIDNPEKWFSNDFSELNTYIGYQPNNRVKVAIGVREADGKQYQDTFNRSFMRLNAVSTKMMSRVIQEAKENGAYQNTTFSMDALHEYKVEPTNFETSVEQESEDDLPF